jgi:hypothetical protein
MDGSLHSTLRIHLSPASSQRARNAYVTISVLENLKVLAILTKSSAD